MGGLIWLASYPKSGNTWMRAFLANLLADLPSPVPVNNLGNFCIGESDRKLYEGVLPKPLEEVGVKEITALRPRVHESLTHFSKGPVFVKTHNYMGSWFDVPLLNLQVTKAAIYIVRNPLDVVPSAANHFNETIDQAIKRLATVGNGTPLTASHIPEVHNSWSLHVDTWSLHPNPHMLALRYEDLVANPEIQFRRVMQFLGLPQDEKRLQKAIRHSSFNALKAQEDRGGFRERPEHSKAFFREGRSEAWRDILTPDQVRQIINDHRATMQRLGYIPEDYA
ncbi:MAG: sulfotransferase domain-containing protein [Rhizobiales bacterium]|nr:sulfotransferase domain-containing protein [Hyphomicrobiales bacterium]